MGRRIGRGRRRLNGSNIEILLGFELRRLRNGGAFLKNHGGFYHSDWELRHEEPSGLKTRSQEHVTLHTRTNAKYIVIQGTLTKHHNSSPAAWEQLSLRSKGSQELHNALAASPAPESTACSLAFPLPIPPSPTPIRRATYLCATTPMPRLRISSSHSETHSLGSTPPE